MGKSSKSVPPDALKKHSLALPVPRTLSLHYKTLFFVEDFLKIHIFKLKNIMAMNLWELRSNQSWKDAVRGIIQSSVN